MVFNKRVTRNISGPRTNEVRGDQKKLHTKEIHDFKYTPNIVQLNESRKI